MLIYLADIYHASGKPATPTPTNIGYIAAYCIKKFGKKVEIKLFKHPQKLLDAIDKKAPDILGLSNYMWNENLNIFMCNYAKEKNKNLITVTGGPNLRTDRESMKKYLIKNREYDFAILYGAEIPFSNLVEAALTRKRNDVKKSKIEGCYFLDINDDLVGEYFLSDEKNLDYIPSPFLTGLMDEFLEEGYYPLFETNRGCPFSCTFCVWGISVLHKIKTFSFERVKEEFNYVADNFGKSTHWFLADANFGILPRDVDLAKLLREIYDRKDSFDIVILYWAKNVTERSYKIAKTLGKLCEAYVALQSLDPNVLKLIKRSNISVEKLLHFKNEVGPFTKGSLTDILLGQPGETKQSHMNSYYGAMKLGFDTIGGGEIRLLPGSEMDEEKSRLDYGLKTKYRIGEGSLGIYRDKFIFELEEVIRSTNWISEKEMLELRTLRALVFTSTNLGELAPINSVLVKNNINILEVFDHLIKNIKKNTELSKMINELNTLAKDEWFESKESAIKHYSEVFSKRNLKDISPVKLNFWVLSRLLKSRNLYKEFLENFRNSVLTISKNIKPKVLDDLLYLCKERNVLRSILDNDFSIKKELILDGDTIDELYNANVIYSIPSDNKIFLKIPKEIHQSIKKRLENFNKHNDLDNSYTIQNFSGHFQMQITINNAHIIDTSLNTDKIVNQGNFN